MSQRGKFQWEQSNLQKWKAEARGSALGGTPLGKLLKDDKLRGTTQEASKSNILSHAQQEEVERSVEALKVLQEQRRRVPRGADLNHHAQIIYSAVSLLAHMSLLKHTEEEFRSSLEQFPDSLWDLMSSFVMPMLKVTWLVPCGKRASLAAWQILRLQPCHRFMPLLGSNASQARFWKVRQDDAGVSDSKSKGDGRTFRVNQAT